MNIKYIFIISAFASLFAIIETLIRIINEKQSIKSIILNTLLFAWNFVFLLVSLCVLILINK